MAEDKDTQTQTKDSGHPDDRSGSDCYLTIPDLGGPQ
jgi:hypothetical protein